MRNNCLGWEKTAANKGSTGLKKLPAVKEKVIFKSTLNRAKVMRLIQEKKQEKSNTGLSLKDDKYLRQQTALIFRQITRMETSFKNKKNQI